MQVKLKKQAQCLAEASIKIPNKEAREYQQKIIKKYQDGVNLQGFRKGKAPKEIVEKKYQKQIKEDLKSTLLNQGITEAVKTHKLRVLQCEVQEIKADSKENYEIKAIFILSPKFTLPKYKEIEISIKKEAIGEQEIEKELQLLREKSAESKEIKNRPLQKGDLALISYTTKYKNKPLQEAFNKTIGIKHLASKEDFWLKIDKNSFLPDFCLQLEGMNINEKKKFNFKLPKDFSIKELSQKEIQFSVSLKELKELQLPELNDEFANKFLPNKTLKELKELISESLKQQQKQQAKEEKNQQIFRYLDEKSKFDLPEKLVQEETQRIIQSTLEQNKARGINEEDLEKIKQQIATTAKQQATANLKIEFILQEIAQKEKIQITEIEFQENIKTMAQMRKSTPEKIMKEMEKNKQIQNIRYSMNKGKIIDFLIDNAKLKII